jgi:hypothetical protein
MVALATRISCAPAQGRLRMAGNLIGALTVDAKRRHEKAERAAIATPPEEIAARNAVIAALVELPDPRRALAVCLALNVASVSSSRYRPARGYELVAAAVPTLRQSRGLALRITHQA